MPLPSCAHCGDVIGVYEPLVMLTGDEAFRPHIAAQPDLSPQGGYYHGACHAATTVEDRPAEHGLARRAGLSPSPSAQRAVPSR